ncbi:TetR/AcrR family transcriptional regulator [Sphingobium sufflavum]|uniref:TetR/AcrR family transcriptional regulator n=1 Tax=Sphingobium sufflavum TaxID=1129547 RepID=UPI001F22FE3B|nr:TetR/AcrR family transcriptional regulator [Sphingobium sufflavum]MCE7796536.1 TetR/AcrR family transcriptional regulator [Sphingobium sufflavum]
MSEGQALPLAERSDPRIRRTRKAFRQALQELLQEMPLEAITIRDIVARADIAYTTYFRHYATKEALLDDLAHEEIGKLLDLTYPVMASKNGYASCETLCLYVSANRALWSALLTGGAQGAIRTAFVELTLARESQWPQVQSWLPKDIGTTLAVTSIVELLAWWLRQVEPVLPARVAEIMDRVIVSTLMGTAYAEP